MKSIALVLALAAHVAAEGGGEYEWAGLFALHHGETYEWTAQKVDGAYADASMKIVVLDTGTTAEDASGIEAQESQANTLMAGTCTDVQNNGKLMPGACYNLVFDNDVDTSVFHIEMPKEEAAAGHEGHGHDEEHGEPHAIFTEHFPTEFESDKHYLHDDKGVEVEPVVCEPACGEHDGGGHAHGHGGGDPNWKQPYDWVGLFEMEADAGESYTWTMQKTEEFEGHYMKQTMKLNVVELEVGTDKEAREAIKVGSTTSDAAAATMETDCDTAALANSAFDIPGCRKLTVDDSFYSSLFNMEMGGHGHGGDHEYEWAGLFNLQYDDPKGSTPDMTYTLTFSKVDGAYADATMEILVMAAPDGTIESQEDAADGMIKAGCDDVQVGGKFIPGMCYNLVFDQAAEDSVYTLSLGPSGATPGLKHIMFLQHMPGEFEKDHHYIVDAQCEGACDVEPIKCEPSCEGGGHGAHDGHDGHRRLEGHAGDDPHAGHEHGYYAIYAEYDPMEFELDSHYLKNAGGADIEPIYAEFRGKKSAGGGGGGGRNRNYPRAWKNSMLACLAVLAVTTTGAFLRYALAAVGLTEESDHEAFCVLAGAFAVGCLLATSYFLIFVEAVHLTGARWKVEAQSTWRFGTMALLGYLVGMLSTMCEDFFHVGHKAHDVQKAKAIEGGEAKDDTEGQIVEAEEFPPNMYGPGKINWGFVFVIFFGDFLHNFVDGIFIANAFLDCSVSKGWTIAGATVAHEIAQETSDFFLLITEGGLNTLWALIINLISGISVFIGAAVYLWTKPGNGTRGLVLAFSGGIYVYIAATEAAACFTHKRLSPKMKLGVIFLFILGAVAIGLVLLDHEHCEGDPEAGSGGHAGHNH